MNRLDIVLKNIVLLEGKESLTQEEEEELNRLYQEEELEYERRDKFNKHLKKVKKDEYI